MSGRPLSITQRQIEAICRGAAKAGMRAELRINDTLIRLVPANEVTQPIDEDMETILDRELAAFKVKHGYS